MVDSVCRCVQMGTTATHSITNVTIACFLVANVSTITHTVCNVSQGICIIIVVTLCALVGTTLTSVCWHVPYANSHVNSAYRYRTDVSNVYSNTTYYSHSINACRNVHQGPLTSIAYVSNVNGLVHNVITLLPNAHSVLLDT